MKKVLAILLGITMLLMMLPMGAVSVSAAARSQAEAKAWIENAVGRFWDYDNVWGAQCVDIIRYYYAYLGVTSYSGNANMYVNAEALPNDQWKHIPYYDGFVAQPGDIAIFLGPSSAGHIALVITADVNEMYVVDQNYTPPYEGTDNARTTTYAYSQYSFYGVIRPDLQIIPEGLVIQEYRTHCQVKVTKNCTVKSLPCSKSTNADSVDMENASTSNTYEAISMVKNNQGNLWYLVKLRKGGTGYLFAGNTDTTNVTQLTDDVSVANVLAPSTINTGSDFSIGGTINTKYQSISMVSVWATDTKGNTVIGIFHNTSIGEYAGKTIDTYPLRDSVIDKELHFEKLSAGNYTYRISAAVQTYYASSGTTASTRMTAIENLHSSNFTVGVHTHTYNEYVYNWAAHPHYACYKCTCGEVVANYNQPDYSASCSECNSTSTATITEGNYFLRCKGNDNYLNVTNGDDYNCNTMHTWRYGGWNSQVFEITLKSDGYEMRPLSSQMRVVNPYSDNVSDGNTVNLYDRTNDSSQWWKFQDLGGSYVIRNSQNPNVCLTPGNEYMEVSTYTGSNYQIWYLEKACTVTYNANGGSGAPAVTYARSGIAMTLNSAKPTRSCYTFLGWSASKTATSATWSAGGSATFTSDTTLYAVWGNASHIYSNCVDTSCNTCGFTRVVSGHIYSNDCDNTCDVCGATREVSAHDYWRETTTSATCGSTGVLTYTCIKCQYSYTETIPAKGNHTYTDGSDAVCDICGFIRVPGEIPMLKVDDVQTYFGSIITVPIRMINNPGVAKISMSVHYDNELLEMVSCNPGVSGMFSYSYTSSGSSVWINWYQPGLGDYCMDGIVASVVFRVKGEGNDVCSQISLSYEPKDVFNEQLEMVDFAIVNGDVMITNARLGDANNDNKVNVRDLGLMQQHINGWSVGVVAAACDVNGDGKINVRDLGLLQQYINGWDVTLGAAP